MTSLHHDATFLGKFHGTVGNLLGYIRAKPYQNCSIRSKLLSIKYYGLVTGTHCRNLSSNRSSCVGATRSNDDVDQSLLIQLERLIDGDRDVTARVRIVNVELDRSAAESVASDLAQCQANCRPNLLNAERPGGQLGLAHVGKDDGQMKCRRIDVGGLIIID